MFALVDANSFYCSCEAVFRPDYRDKPIVVLSNNDGVIVAANRKAKEAGIPKFSPYFKVKALCEQKGVVVCSSNYELYADLSSKMMNVIGRFAPDQYIYSIDESFLSFDRVSKAIPDLREHALNLRKTVWKETRLPVCVGIGNTLTLSKIANNFAKKRPDLNGVCVLETEEQINNALSHLEASDVWGIGKRLATHFKHLGVNTALQLKNYPVGLARKNFNVDVERIVRELNGERCKSWDNVQQDKKQIFSTRSVGERIESLDELIQALSQHANIASRKARNQKSLCKVMLCFAASSSYDDKPVSHKAIHRFAYPTSDVHQITSACVRMAKEIFRENVRYYKIGVGLLDLVDGRNEQPDLFNPEPNNDKLMSVFDKLNDKYGRDTVFLGSQGTQKKWEMRRELLSPQYTTNWKHIPVINCK
ncbi:Y-family DNA polymerase [Vibrio parahaemolyticus]|uniref:Y-family DNA polymerase n=1 Tax=Vibrio parahaemolyticus TaxID=670 RepID=UPI000C276FA6|nr:Y-family DNA polymerase [Vibrio parahaemolyticus]PJN44109.1 DNA polymerase V subunit UmuC [Vibrio parahaemolyticus]